MINPVRHSKRLRTNLHPKILRRLGCKFASPMELHASDCVPSVHNLHFVTPASDVGRLEVASRSSRDRGKVPPRLLLPCDGVIFGGSWGDQSCIKLAPRVCVSLKSQAASVSRRLPRHPPPSAGLDHVSVDGQYKGIRDKRGKVGTKQKE